MIKIITEPTIIVLGETCLSHDGLHQLATFVTERAPECSIGGEEDLLPDRLDLGAETLCELAGRTCYYSFGKQAGRKSTTEYLRHIREIGHLSILYHAKMTFFFAGISRRMTHELIRHYVGSDRDEEGSPSQESTRYTRHPGWFVQHPGEKFPEAFAESMEWVYRGYLRAVAHAAALKGLERKRVYEAAAMLLPGAAATSMVWTSNPVALTKMIRERTAESADLEFRRFAELLGRICVQRWPALFPADLVG